MSNLTFKISMTAPHSHLYEVEVSLEHPGEKVLFQMPAWTPGSYLIREYARHVQDMRAYGSEGQEVAWRKVGKAAWEVDAGNQASVTLSYRVYAHELTVRTSHLDMTHGYFNGATMFACPQGHENSPSSLIVEPAFDWIVSVALPSVGPNRFAVENFDQLVDSPVECGTHEEVVFDVASVPHRWASWGDDFDVSPYVEDIRVVIEKEIELFGELPADVDDYLFICHVQERRNGGLEHKKSQTLGIDRRTSTHAPSYEDFITLVAHEYFHVWNVKRIRAKGLGPFNYNQEAYTPLLWMMEGLTGYYDTLIPVRAGVMSIERYLEILGERIGSLRSQPGRFVRSLEESSMDAWIKLYRPDENTPNSTISYYLKGELVALLLDFVIRDRSNGTKSLDDVMRHLWVRQRDTGQAIDPTEVDDLFEAATGLDLSKEIDAWTRGKDDLPYEELLALAGLSFAGSHKKTYDRSRMADGEKKSPAPWMGLTTLSSGGRTLIKNVISDSPAAEAGLNPGDELLAISGLRVSHGSWQAQLALEKDGATIEVVVARRKRLHTMTVTLNSAPFDTFKVKPKKDASAKQRNILESWLQRDWPTTT
jgi:predicted metalloprotease with PDZ domain